MSPRTEAVIPPGTRLPGPTESQRNLSFLLFTIRDAFSIPAWLSMGAVLQAALFMLPIKTHYAVLPALLFIVLQSLDALLVTLGLRRNTMMDHVVQRKYSAMFPDEDGHFHHLEDSADKKVEQYAGRDSMVLFILNFRVNHPLGPLAPGAAGIGKGFVEMQNDLAANRANNGFLGSTIYRDASSRTTHSELATHFWFRSLKDLYDFAYGPVHKAGWDYFRSVAKTCPHLAIAHETYVMQKGGFETIYVNWEPSGFAATQHPRKGKNGETILASSIVDAKAGRLSHAKGRFGDALE